MTILVFISTMLEHYQFLDLVEVCLYARYAEAFATEVAKDKGGAPFNSFVGELVEMFLDCVQICSYLGELAAFVTEVATDDCEAIFESFTEKFGEVFLG